jgi:2-polyprenyl-3-methyl-5-hydroxy-6-metoxy-1,4-benzoquinol methylase
MSKSVWNGSLEFLKAIRTGWLNDDYIEFLVEKVWKINKPVNIIDFGCGFGYVGLLLLPILPKGSTYTGIDINESLLDAAKRNFENSGYITNFIKADLNEFIPSENYDIAISQAVLRHIPNAKNILEKMIQSVVSGGMVICMETDLELEKAGHYFSGLDYFKLGLPSLYRKYFTKELADGGRDYRFGIKIPEFMQELGLKNIGVRMSDSIKFINPHGDTEEHAKQFEAITSAWGWNKQLSDNDKINSIKSFMNRGLNEQEAEMFVAGQMKISEYVMNNKDNAYIIQAPCTIISFGTK